MQVRRTAEFLLEVPEFGEEGVLVVDVFVELLVPLTAAPRAVFLDRSSSRRDSSLRIFGLDVVEQGFEEDVLVEPVVVDP